MLNRRGLDRAIAAGCDEVTVVVVASDGLALRNQGVDTAAQVAAWRQIAADARAAGLRHDGDHRGGVRLPVRRRGRRRRGCSTSRAPASTAGPDELAIADTIGVGVPAPGARAGRRSARLDAAIPLRAHFHNTRNTGYANALAAIEAGVTVLDASAGGIGGCPFAPGATGNIATEDLAYLLDRSGIDTGVDRRVRRRHRDLDQRPARPPPGPRPARPGRRVPRLREARRTAATDQRAEVPST